MSDVKGEVVDQYTAGYKQGNKRGLFGLLSLWADKAQENVPYAGDARQLAMDGTDRLAAEGDAAYSDIKHKAYKTKAGVEARLSALGETVDGEVGRFQDGFQQGRALGKDIEKDAPGQARAAFEHGEAITSDLTNEAIDLAQAGLEKNKEVSSEAQEGLEGMRP